MMPRKFSKLRRALLFGSLLAISIVPGVASAAAHDVIPAPNKSLPSGDLSRSADNFYKSAEVEATAISFPNAYDMKVAGNLFVPKTLDKTKRHPAIVVGHPMGAVKEQSANLYAQKMAERGYVTVSFDLSYWGESAGTPKNSVAPDVYADDYSAAIDYLSALPYVDGDRIGVIGICAGGGFAISEAKIDPRMKAIATVSMVDMGSAMRSMMTKEQRDGLLAATAAERTAESQGAPKKYVGGTPDTAAEATDAMSKDFYDFYRTARGSYGDLKASHTTHPTMVTNVKFLNFYPFEGIETIAPRPLLFIAGTEAVSLSFSQAAYEKAAEPKELYLVKGANHVDLYDRTELIPFEKLAAFFQKALS